ncbi:pyridoxamine 5'-phosphate oxidase family protein [Luteibacter sp.]|uniref:pyridoxamine 5'-phosphate oxidase family protein n=1 Tax=Luteibacter sp. TaxID=1886636 RepID=UPI002809AE1B|nr:pyridoxamine 5'-phosphate oxidase family protein [Luteibacter sp.]MDQ8051323.1 pyridoxamine 5'-phosphate oxidase family protein [Luteibacter sp.]
MTKPEDLEQKFWQALKSDMTMMLGVDGLEQGHTRPMTAQLENENQGPIWYFTSTDNALVKQLDTPRRAIAAFSAKGHSLFASIGGQLSVDTDPTVVERLWNPFVAAWYEGKNDPKLALLRLDPDQGEVWLNENNLLAGVKMLMGIDPKKDYQDKVAKVDLRSDH